MTKAPKGKIVVIDAAGRSIGRVATEVATILRGKRTVAFEPRLFPNLEVHIVNIAKVRFTGTKLTAKKFYSYSGYPGGLKTTTLAAAWAKDPVRVVRHALRGMLPKNRLQDKMMRNVKIFLAEPK